jgi:hypothetical protein
MNDDRYSKANTENDFLFIGTNTSDGDDDPIRQQQDELKRWHANPELDNAERAPLISDWTDAEQAAAERAEQAKVTADRSMVEKVLGKKAAKKKKAEDEGPRSYALQFDTFGQLLHISDN